jgi:diguanylate cyclase (GGDEF)-like protein
MPASVKTLVAGAVAVGAAVVVACAAIVAGGDVERLDLVAVLAAGMLVCELFPIQIPGREEEVSFSTSFTFALLITHGTAEAVLVATGTMLLADLLRRRPPVKIAYNASQYAVSWAVAGVVYELLAGSPSANVVTVAPQELLALLAAGLAYGVVNGMLAPLPPALLGGGMVWPQLKRGIEFVVATTLALVALAPIVVVVAGRDLWLVPLLGVPLAAIQLGARQAVINEARARIDAVSGALTRGELEHELGRRLHARGSEPAVVLVDIVGFADVNDALGYHAGDVVLATVADRLGGSVARGERVARTGGDAFAVLCGADRIESVVGLVEAALEPPVPIKGLAVDVRAVLGVASAPAPDAATLLREADVALRAAKTRGLRWARFEPAMSAGAAERLALAPELRRAIGAGELVLHYQPKIDLRTGALAGVEALVRWERPGHGLVPPGTFIDLAERTGLIRPLTSWVLRTAIAEQGRWSAGGLDVPVAVNLSARVLHPELVEEVAAILKGARHSSGSLELEVTESAAMRDPERSLAVLQGLAGLGLRLSVDDFGTGHSSLAYLSRLPVAALKIDRTFVAGLAREPANRSIVATTVELGQRLGLDVVAEGVEDDAVLAILRTLGCELAQGVGIARPMPAGAVPAWAAERAGLTRTAAPPRG